MLFNSLEFFWFMAVVLLAVGVLPNVWRKRFLLVASYFFYGSWDWRFLGLIFITTVVDYSVGGAIYRTMDPLRRKRLLLISLVVDLGILGFFKYFGFFVGSAVDLLQALGLQATAPTLQIILPVGISFYTFQSMSYSIDIYRRQAAPVQRFEDFALYVSYFPQLVAGPIERADSLTPQLLAPARLTPAWISTGLTLIVVGYAKKVLIADSVAPEVDRIFSQSSDLSSGVLLRGAYLFVLQIYGDFSGYSDIARGVSHLLGVRLSNNFEQPYLAQSLTEFWRRWHISLSSWLRDYLYIPLGGNRHGPARSYINLMLTMLIGGLWHGAAWTYVAWGGLNGLVLAIERAFGIGRTPTSPPADPVRRWVRRVALTIWTFHMWVFIMIFFRASTLAGAVEFVAGILAFSDLAAVGSMPFLVGMAVLLIDIPQFASGDHAVFWRLPWWLRSPLYCGILAAVVFIIVYGGSDLPFIYFQF